MKMCLRQQVALLYSQWGVLEEVVCVCVWGGEVINRLTAHRLECMRSRLTKKSASCRLPSTVMSSPAEPGSSVRPCKNTKNHCNVRNARADVAWPQTHRRSRGMGRLPLSGRTAAQTHTSRHPPRSHCRPTLQRHSRWWATEQRSHLGYNCKGNYDWLATSYTSALRRTVQWRYKQYWITPRMWSHTPSSNALVDPNHCRTTLTPSSVIIFGYLLRKPSNWMTFLKQIITNCHLIIMESVTNNCWTKQNVNVSAILKCFRVAPELQQFQQEVVASVGHDVLWTPAMLETPHFPYFTLIIKPWRYQMWARVGGHTL